MWLLFIIGHMGLFVYTQKGSIISTVDLPTTEIIEPFKAIKIRFSSFHLPETKGISFNDFDEIVSCF
ncbi:hypothetical protein CWI26_02790 [Streptococcus suis]|uniref:Uncharacterized protein n=1 Tax=Streptococcus suis TaxID=1307 RepID=A0A2I5KMA6_STRSU|nr:hypothetical protein CWI26_02790 [Streptococcus suis]